MSIFLPFENKKSYNYSSLTHSSAAIVDSQWALRQPRPQGLLGVLNGGLEKTLVNSRSRVSENIGNFDFFFKLAAGFVIGLVKVTWSPVCQGPLRGDSVAPFWTPRRPWGRGGAWGACPAVRSVTSFTRCVLPDPCCSSSEPTVLFSSSATLVGFFFWS